MTKLKTLNLISLPFVGAIASLTIATPSHAIPLVSYDFGGNADATVSVPALLTASPVTVFGTNNPPVLVASGGQPNGYAFSNSPLSFTLTPTIPPVQFLNLNAFVFFARKDDITLPPPFNITIPGATSLSLFSSLDNFATAIDTVNLNKSFSPYSFNISGVAFDSITSPITFKISPSSSAFFSIDTIRVGGTLGVPYEFETAAGVLLFAGYFAGKRYLKSKAKVKA